MWILGGAIGFLYGDFAGAAIGVIVGFALEVIIALARSE